MTARSRPRARRPAVSRARTNVSRDSSVRPAIVWPMRLAKRSNDARSDPSSVPSAVSSPDMALSASSPATATRSCGNPSYPSVWAARITVARPTPTASVISCAVRSTVPARSSAMAAATRRSPECIDGASATILAVGGASADPSQATCARSFHDAAAQSPGDGVDEHRGHDDDDQQHSDGRPLTIVRVVGQHASDAAGKPTSPSTAEVRMLISKRYSANDISDGSAAGQSAPSAARRRDRRPRRARPPSRPRRGTRWFSYTHLPCVPMPGCPVRARR